MRENPNPVTSFLEDDTGEAFDNLFGASQYPSQYDDDFHVGDPVIVVVTKYDDARKRIYGRIVSKW